MSAKPTIIYTKTDEAPALATYSLLPIVQAFTKHAGHRGGNPRHLARRPHPRPVPGIHRRRPEIAMPRRTRRPHPQARGEHHQAAEHFRLRPAAQGRHRRASGQGLRSSRISRKTRPPMPKRKSAPATPRSWAAPSIPCCARATPTAARRRPSRTTPEAPALDGRLVRRFQNPRRHHGRQGRFLLQREVRHRRRGHRRHASSSSPPTAPSPCSRNPPRSRPVKSSTPPS